MIKVRQHTPIQLKTFNSNNQFIGYINNAVELIDLHIQIVEQQVDGYYIMYGDKKVNIYKNYNIPEEIYELYYDGINLARKLQNLLSEIK